MFVGTKLSFRIITSKKHLSSLGMFPPFKKCKQKNSEKVGIRSSSPDGGGVPLVSGNVRSGLFFIPPVSYIREWEMTGYSKNRYKTIFLKRPFRNI